MVKTFGKNYNEGQDIRVTQELQECQIHKQLTEKKKKNLSVTPWGEGGVPPGSPYPDPISDQNMSFSTPVLRPDL